MNNEEKLVFENLESRKIDTNLLLKGYISFFLDKYDLKNDINNNLIELLLNLKYNSEQNNFIKENEKEPIKIMLTIYLHSEKLFNDKSQFFEMIKKKYMMKIEA